MSTPDSSGAATGPRLADDLPAITAPTVDRPAIPDGYGVVADPAGTLDWETVRDKLIGSLHYWLTSVRPSGAPHTVPRWGVWLDNRFFYDGAPTTRHTRNVEINPACTLSLESGTDVSIVEGESVSVRAAADGVGVRLAEAFGKYADLGYRPEADAWTSPADGGGLRVITPCRVLAWSSFPTDCTRFVFERAM